MAKAWNQVCDDMNIFFLDSIPSDDVKQLPPRYLYPIGVVIIAMFIAIFVAVLVPGYESAVRTKFLSPVGSGNSRYCEDVAISNTGTFLATQTGTWQGSPFFAYSNATYQINLVNVQMNEEQFSRSMNQFYAQLQDVGRITKRQNLGVNLLYWMSWVQVGENLERFSMTGTPLMVFQREHTVGTISNRLYDCNATSRGSFDPSTGIIGVSYSLDSYQNNPMCAGNGNLSSYGWSAIANSGTFDLEFDIRSLVTAVAVNLGVVDPLTQLQLVDSVYYPVDGENYFSATFVDPRYPGMAPVSCLFRNNIPYCLINVGFMYGIPVFNHIGENLMFPHACNCSEELPKGVNSNYYNNCNVFNFLTGVIVWPHAPPIPDPALNLMLSTPTQKIYEEAYIPMFTAGVFGQHSPVRDIFNSPEQRREMYAFCDSDTYGPCSIVTFSSYDSTYPSHTVATNYYIVEYGACQDTFSTAASSW